MLHLFKAKNLIGKKNGFLGKKSFILMLLTWMIDRDLIVNAQGSQTNFVKEKKPVGWREKKLKNLTEDNKRVVDNGVNINDT